MYNDPNLNIIVSSPGRTGSSLIWDLFTKVTKITPLRRNYNENFNKLRAKECLHSHTPEDVLLGNENTLTIVSTRNLCEAALSSSIVKHTGKYFFYEDRDSNIDAFFLDPKEFLIFYDSKKKFYEELKIILPKNHIILKYECFENNWTSLFDILQISTQSLKFLPKNLLPIKRPGTFKDWILNYNDIENIIATLNPYPCI